MMNALHDQIVSRFRAGETIMAIGLSIGYSRRHVRNVIGAATPTYRRGRQLRFESRADGEYCQCGRCARIGYGVDAWHPVSEEFWPMDHGRLSLVMCKACRSELMAKKSGTALLRIAA